MCELEGGAYVCVQGWVWGRSGDVGVRGIRVDVFAQKYSVVLIVKLM